MRKKRVCLLSRTLYSTTMHPAAYAASPEAGHKANAERERTVEPITRSRAMRGAVLMLTKACVNGKGAEY